MGTRIIDYDLFNKVAAIEHRALEQFPELKRQIELNLGECNFFPSFCGAYGNCVSVIFFHLPQAPDYMTDEDIVKFVQQEDIISGSLLSIHRPSFYEVYNVCVKNKYRGKGIVNNLFYAMFNFYYKKGMTKTFWLQIDFDNPYFSSVLKIYAKLGFKDPAISNLNSDREVQQDKYYLTLVKTNDFFQPNETIVFGNNFKEIYRQSLNPPRKEEVLISKNTLEYLFEQVEVSPVEIGGGLFVVDNVDGIPVMGLVNKNFNIGLENEVSPVNPSNGRVNRYAFHIHQKANRVFSDTFYASPSSRDIVALINYPQILCSLIFAQEGIYVTYRHPDFLIPNKSCSEVLSKAVFQDAINSEKMRVKQEGKFYRESDIKQAIDNFTQIANSITLRSLFQIFPLPEFERCIELTPQMLDLNIFIFGFIPINVIKNYFEKNSNSPGLPIEIDSRFGEMDEFQYAVNAEDDHQMDLS